MQDTILLKSWYFNIGDGFVKLGAEHILNAALGPDRVMVSAELGATKFNMIGDGAANPDFTSLVDLVATKPWTLVMPGCVLHENLHRIVSKVEQLPVKPRVVFLGAGGHHYDDKVVTSVRESLMRLDTHLLVARDNPTLECYGELFKHAHKGLDCAYWVSDAVPGMAERSDFTIRTFNRMMDPGHSEGQVFRFEHSPLRLAIEPRHRAIARNLWRMLRPQKVRTERDDFISDDIPEYLRLYSAAKEVHTDMVHATVACLSYGTPVQMYYRSGREGVLTSVFGERMFEGVFRPDMDELAALKAAEVAKIRDILG